MLTAVTPQSLGEAKGMRIGSKTSIETKIAHRVQHFKHTSALVQSPTVLSPPLPASWTSGSPFGWAESLSPPALPTQ